MNPLIVRFDAIESDLWIHYNDKRPWWKTKRPLFLVKKGRFIIIDLRDQNGDFSKWYVKKDEKLPLIPASELADCLYDN